MRSDLGRGHSSLRPPVVVNAAAVETEAFAVVGIRVLYTSSARVYLPRRDLFWELRPPVVVATTSVFFGPKITLNVHLPEQRRIRASKRSPDYELKPPTVIGAGISFDGPGTLLARDSRSSASRVRFAVESTLSPPAVVEQEEEEAFFGPRETLARARRGKAKSRLQPAIIPPLARPIAIHLAPSRRLLAKSRLSPPAHVQVEPNRPGQVHLTYSRRGKPRSTYVYPIVVFRLEAFGYLAIQLNRIRPRPTTHLLRPPSVTAEPAVEIYGPVVTLVQIGPRSTTHVLQPPVVVESPGTEIYGPETHLVRIKPPATAYILRPAAPEAGPGIEIYGPETQLVRIRPPRVGYDLAAPVVINASLGNQGGVGVSLAPSRRPITKSILRPPAVVDVAVVVYYGPSVQLTFSRRPITARSVLRAPIIPLFARPLALHLTSSRRGVAKSVLAPPAHVQIDPNRPVLVHLTYSRRGEPQYFLRPPVVVLRPLARPITTRFAPSTRGKAKSRLTPPVVVLLAVEIYGPEIALTPSHKGVTHSVLRPPVVVFLAVEISGPEVTLSPSRRPITKSRLAPPTDVLDLVETGVGPFWLTYSKRGAPKSHLAPPADTIGLEDQGVVGIWLAYSRRGTPKPALAPPAHIQVDPNRPAIVHLAYSRRGAPKSHLTPPADTVGREDQGHIVVTLAPSPLPKTRSHLSAPAVVGDGIVYRPLQVHLTYSRRGTPKSRIFPGLVGRDVFFGPVVTLAPQRRGVPKSRLQAPVVIFRPLARAIQIHLTPQRRGTPRTFLRPAVIPPLARPTAIHLAYSLRGRAKPFLRLPVVVDLAIEIYGPKITLVRIQPRPTTTALRLPTDLSDAQDIGTLETHFAPSTRGKTTSFLSPPAVVGFDPFRGILVWLAPSSRGQTFQFQIPPLVGETGSEGPVVHLARIKPPPVLSLLKPPTVVGAGIAFFGPEVHFARIKPPKVVHFVIEALVEQPFVPPRGDVCGFDISESFICFIELPSTKVFGGNQSNANIESTTASDSKISGGDMASGKAIGGDQEAN